MKTTFANSSNKPKLSLIIQKTHKRRQIEAELDRAYKLMAESEAQGKKVSIYWMPNGKGGYSPYVFEIPEIRPDDLYVNPLIKFFRILVHGFKGI